MNWKSLPWLVSTKPAVGIMMFYQQFWRIQGFKCKISPKRLGDKECLADIRRSYLCHWTFWKLWKDGVWLMKAVSIKNSCSKNNSIYIFFPHYCLILARTLFEGKTGQKLNQHLHSLRQIFSRKTGHCCFSRAAQPQIAVAFHMGAVTTGDALIPAWGCSKSTEASLSFVIWELQFASLGVFLVFGHR